MTMPKNKIVTPEQLFGLYELFDKIVDIMFEIKEYDLTYKRNDGKKVQVKVL